MKGASSQSSNSDNSEILMNFPLVRSQVQYLDDDLLLMNIFHLNIHLKRRFKLNLTIFQIQLRGAQILDVVRLHKNGFPENMTFGEFWRKYKVLLESSNSLSGNLPVEKLKSAVQDLLEELDLDQSAVRLGNTQVGFL